MIEIASNIGFCFGVNRAIKIAEDLLNKGLNVTTLGQIIHNNYVCENLKSKGLKVIETIDEFKQNKQAILILRSHGVSPFIYSYCKQNRLDFVDTTCPFVKKIHKIVELNSKKGKNILILGNSSHPEVCAIKSYCVGEVEIFANFIELENYLQNVKVNKKFVLVSQTTFDNEEWNSNINLILNKFKDILEIYKTICPSTIMRQRESINLAKKADLIIVIGGKHSSNSRKLARLCQKFSSTIFVEDVSELQNNLNLKDIKNVGIVSGTSTPKKLINDIYKFLETNTK